MKSSEANNEDSESMPKGVYPRAVAVVRFWKKVEKTKGCWLWKGAKREGYGLFSISHDTQVPAHNFAYQQLTGPIPDGLLLDHLCRNHACVNPAHLQPVTNKENVLRGIAPTAVNAKKTHCQKGHEYSPENTYYDGKGRQCRTCRRLRQRESRLKAEKDARLDS